MRAFLLVFLLVFLADSILHAQSTQFIRGTVIDQNTGVPLIGATVLLLDHEPLTGTITDHQGFFSLARTCSRCGGAGTVINNPCRACQGQGMQKKQKDLKLKIPAGVDSGSRLRLTGEGEAGPRGGVRGDLYVVIHVREHEFYSREENHLVCTVPLGFSQAALGTELTLPGLGESEGVELKIPEGTQSGTTFRVRGAGVQGVGGGTGDLYARVEVHTPKKLSREARELFEQLSEVETRERANGEKTLFSKVKDIFN